MHPLIFLFVHTFVNGIKRALTTPKRTISLLFFGAYYYFALMRPLTPEAPMPAVRHLPQVSIPDPSVIDGVVFGLFVVMSMIMMSTLLSYRGSFRPADVDVLFPTPINPRIILVFRMVRDYFFTLLTPIFLCLLGWRGASFAAARFFRNYPHQGGDILRLGWLAWMLMSLAFVSLGYGASLFVGRSDTKSDRNRTIINYSFAAIVVGAIVYIGYCLNGDFNWATALSLTHVPGLRIVFLPASMAAAIVSGGFQGQWDLFAAGLSGLLLLVLLGIVAAMTQVDWLYDQAAAKGLEGQAMRNLRRTGNMYAITAERARQGKVRRSWLASWIAHMTTTGGPSLVWKDLLMQSRGSVSSMVLMGILLLTTSGVLTYAMRNAGADVDQVMIYLGMACCSAYIFAASNASGIQETLRRVDLLKPLPLSAGQTVFWEVVAKLPVSAVALFLSFVISVCVNPVIWLDSLSAFIFGVAFTLVLLSAMLFGITLFPDIDDVTQRGLSGLVTLLSLVVSSSPGGVLFIVLHYVLHLNVFWAAVPSALLLVLISIGLSTASGYLYAGYNPSEYESPMLHVVDLVKDYKKFTAVDRLSFSIGPGEIIGLLGPNGAGKTTALRCIAGILRPTAGKILVNGFDVVLDQAKAKAGLAFVPEVPSLYELLTVDEHIRFIAMCFKTMDVYEKRIDELLERYDLQKKRNDLVATLSKGMRQKLSVACALVHNANVFLLDEPLIGIDPEGARQLKNELLRAKGDGASILISTHLLDTAEQICDRVLIVQSGKKIAEGTLSDLQRISGHEGKSLEDVFLALTSS